MRNACIKEMVETYQTSGDADTHHPQISVELLDPVQHRLHVVHVGLVMGHS